MRTATLVTVLRLLALISLIVLLPGGTSTSPAYVMGYRINVASFASFSQLGGDPSAAIHYAAQHWAAYAGADLLFDNLGTTNANACDPFSGNTVVGVTSLPGDPGCTVAARNTVCASGWSIRVASCVGPTLGVQATAPISNCTNPAGCTDFHQLLVHEFGHGVLVGGLGVYEPTESQVYQGHLPIGSNGDDPNVVAPGSSPPILGVGYMTGFGSLDVEAVGGPGLTPAWGYGFMNKQLSLANGVGFPAPVGFGVPSSSGLSVGIGFDFQRGRFGSADHNLVASVNPTVATHDARTHELGGSGTANGAGGR